MTRFSVFAALAAVSLLFSCNKSGEVENPQASQPIILIQTRTVSVEAQGGDCEILYTVENAKTEYPWRLRAMPNGFPISIAR